MPYTRIAGAAIPLIAISYTPVRKSRYDDLIKPIIERQNAEREAWNRGRERIINAQIQHDAKLY